MTRLVFAEPAARDLVNIIDYVALDSPLAAERVYRAIVAAAERLTTFPLMGRPGRVAGVREWPVATLPYVIAYEAGSGVVTIVAVFHTSRDLARALPDRRGGLQEASGPDLPRVP